ncbi:MAG: hypothetical protein GTO22_02215 [Gemmatimonadales bacterium]|nr:hypothetical protein [Gemmatimonadales bacterium]
MYTLRCTQRLLRRLPQEVTPEPPAPTTRLGDWYANSLFIRHKQLVLCTSDRSLLSVIVPLKDPVRLPIRLRDAVLSLFQRLGYPARIGAAEAHEMAQVAIGRTANRSVLGSMNDIARHCRWYADDNATFDVGQLELQLAEMPMLTLECAFPREQAAALLGAV